MAVRGFLERAGNTRKLKALIIEGRTDPQIAYALSTGKEKISVRAIQGWKARHKLELDGVKQDVEAQAVGIAIANKRVRLAKLDALATKLEAIMETDLMVEERPVAGELVKIRRFNSALGMEYLRTLRYAAEEMGQIPRWQAPNEGQGYGTPGDVQLAQNVETQNVIIYRGGHDLNMTP